MGEFRSGASGGPVKITEMKIKEILDYKRKRSKVNSTE